MARVGVMIEGQEGLTWELWRNLCRDVEDLELDSLWRSEHLLSVMGGEGRECLETWTSLALAAEWTARIEFGPLVSPMTYRAPAVLARAAASVDQLSGGRLVLGLGAGWYEEEHRRMGIELPPLRERMDRFEAGVKRVKEVLAAGHPTPARQPLPIQIGGSGERRTLRIVAEHADEWNFHSETPDTLRHKLDVLADHCSAVGRDRSTIRLSMMAAFVIGRDEGELRQRAERLRALSPRFEGLDSDALLERLRQRWYVGTPEQIAEQLRPYLDLGVERLMLQHFLMDDRDALELLGNLARLIT